jgi:hypothetical protein
MSLASVSTIVFIVAMFFISYWAVIRTIRQRKSAGGNFGITGRRRNSPRIVGSRLHWIDAAELKRLVAADPELVVFHLIDDDPSEASPKQFDSEVCVTLPQLEEALPWMPRGTRFAVYQLDGISPALAQRLAAITRGREAFFLSGGLTTVFASQIP